MDVVDKQPYFRNASGEEKPIKDMTTPELLSAITFCKKYISSRTVRLKKTAREKKLVTKQRERTVDLLKYIQEEMKERRRVVSSSDLKLGDKFMIVGKDDLYEVSDISDLSSIEPYIEQHKVFRYD